MKVQCEICHAFFDDEVCICLHNNSQAVGSPKRLNAGYCAEHNLFGCMLDHDSMPLASPSKAVAILLLASAVGGVLGAIVLYLARQ